VKGYVVPFVLAFALSVVAFIALDYALMGMQGLDLIFRG
jgi:hypothetical protein